MNRAQVEAMHRRLALGFSLAVDDQQSLFNQLIQLAQSGQADAALFACLDPLLPSQPCAECGGTGEWGEDYDWGLLYPLRCPVCQGTGKVPERAAPPRANSPLDALFQQPLNLDDASPGSF